MNEPDGDNFAPASTVEYIESLLDVLGDRDPLPAQEAFPSTLRAAVTGLSDEDLRRPERPGKWSVLQVVQHLADTELAYGYRMRMILAHDTPRIQAYDQDRWAERLRYDEANLDDALAEFEVLRASNLRLLRGLSDDGWDRTGLHDERGPESIRRIVRMLAGHDLAHLRQIERIKRAHDLA
jgi:uncharacterized damage-inducible protein DinB